MSKALHKHPWELGIESMSPLLLAWYKANIDKDEHDRVEEHIAIAEYLASFSNPKAVEQIRGARKKPQNEISEGMLRTLRAISGKHLTDEQIKKSISQK
jgi:enoyl-CoA hydratase/carnithine racemase